MNLPITFEKASPKHRESVFEWLEAPHVKDFGIIAKAIGTIS